MSMEAVRVAVKREADAAAMVLTLRWTLGGVWKQGWEARLGSKVGAMVPATDAHLHMQPRSAGCTS